MVVIYDGVMIFFAFPFSQEYTSYMYIVPPPVHILPPAVVCAGMAGKGIPK